jgi:CheY-like chemotaxis protein
VTPASQPPALLVLIVDDDERNRRLTGDVLRAGGFRTLEAASGAEALAVAHEHLPDVILMDIRLPDMDGVAVARALGERERTLQIPVVALSSVPLGGDAGTGTGVFAGCLEKPFTVRDFPDQVRRFCAQT